MDISLSHLRGSHSVAQLSDIVVSLQRNVSAGENMAKLKVLKNRFNGTTGESGQLSYNSETGRMVSVKGQESNSGYEFGLV